MSGLSDALAEEVAKRAKSGEWVVVGIAGDSAVPEPVREWSQEQFGVERPIVVVIRKGQAA